MEHRTIIVRLGGIRALARRLGHPHHTTVQGWHSRNLIPTNRWAEVIGVAKEIGSQICLADLVPSDVSPSAHATADVGAAGPVEQVP
ncbi:carph-isopro domain-containing protein [Novosphingobium sp. GV055]|uniref:carph-isopro domain-containing protein n=1 Tax=unclassified Novosphingobium TaxID=2644732 RepID=UPI003511D080